MGLAAPCAIPFQFDAMLGSRLQREGAEVAKLLQTLGDFLSVRFVYRDSRQSVMPAAMIQRRLPLRRQCHGCLRRGRNERERFLPSEPWRHDRKVCSGRKKWGQATSQPVLRCPRGETQCRMAKPRSPASERVARARLDRPPRTAIHRRHAATKAQDKRCRRTRKRWRYLDRNGYGV